MPVKTLSFDGEWKLKEATPQDTAETISLPGGAGATQDSAAPDAAGWMKTRVPGDVHQTLVREGRIADPYYGKNNQDCRWTTERDWWFRREIKVPKNFKDDKVELVFDGIDTFGEVWLNGQKLGETANMFRQYRYDVTGRVNYGETNTVVVRIKATIPTIEARASDRYFACFYVPRIFARKAQCQFSWDWAPFLPSIGLWQGVRLESRRERTIRDSHVRTRINGDVTIHALLDPRERGEGMEDLAADKLVFEIIDGPRTIHGETDASHSKKNFINLHVPNPKLWWPHTHGTPHLYQYRITLLRGERVLDVKEGRFGIREVRLVEDVRGPEKTGFYLLINEVPIFCKGANKVPDDCFPATVTRERYGRVLELARAAEMNMLRIWGGGIYEKDDFYDLCDEKGIMIWHDLMFACSDIPDDDPAFMDEVIKETAYQLKRLRNHPSIVYWCGCNEKTGSAGELITYGDKIYHYIGRGVVNDLMPDVPYRPASPHSFHDAGNNPYSGDTHAACWEPAFRAGMEQFREVLDQIRPFFLSEFGFHGPCQLPSIQKFIPAEDLWPLNGVWHEHIHDNPYSSLEETFMEVQQSAATRLFHAPTSAAEFVKVAGTLHAELVSAEFAHHRRCKPENAAAMVWMLNDCWPSASWSIIDYYGIPKQAYYGAARALAPVLVSVRQAEGKYEIHVTSDVLQDLSGKLTLVHQDVDGQIAFRKEIAVKVDANGSMVALTIPARLIGKLANSYLVARFDYTGSTIKEGVAQTVHFHELWKDITWPEPGLKLRVIANKPKGDEHLLTLEFTTEKFTRCVYLSSRADATAVYSDNYFDMVPGEKKRVTIRSPKPLDPKAIKVNHWKTDWE